MLPHTVVAVTPTAMGKKKKQGGKRRSAAVAALEQEEAKEELLALTAIFGEDIEVHEGHDSLGFTLQVVPHPGEAEANYVSVTLVVRWGRTSEAPLQAATAACGWLWCLSHAAPRCQPLV